MENQVKTKYNSAAGAKRRNSYKLNALAYSQCLGLIVHFFKQNSYFLKKIGKKPGTQLTELKIDGVFVSHTYYNRLKKGTRVCNLLILAFFANYWGLTVGEMLSVDYEERDRLRGLGE